MKSVLTVTVCSLGLLPAWASAGDTHALAQAAGWLWAQQDADGGWHSKTYGVLKSGQAYTPFVLHTLLEVPEQIAPRPPGGVAGALAFLRHHITAQGAIGLSDPDVLEYPNYSTAYALRCFLIAGFPDDALLIARMQQYLLNQQYCEANGFDRQHSAYGGWGFVGPIQPGRAGHMDLAHTRRVLEALRLSGSGDAAAFQRAEHFLRLVQRHPDDPRPQPSLVVSDSAAKGALSADYDGGFYFSPLVLAANKAGEEAAGGSHHFRSYATATCDGLLALLAAGVARDDERLQRASRWLAEHPRLDRPEGIPADHPEPWADALHFYHLAVRAEAYAALRWSDDWRDKIRAHLAVLQHADGHFANDRSHLMKEDDPLLCTSLATIALTRCGTRGQSP